MNGRKLIIGYGNPLRSDDGLGGVVARQVGEVSTDDSVSIRVVHQLTPELAEPVSEADLVIFIDASREGQPGTWKCQEVTADATPSGLVEHNVSTARLLFYAWALYKSRPRAFVISVAAESFACGELLSETVAKVVPEIVGFIHDKIVNPRLGLQAVNCL